MFSVIFEVLPRVIREYGRFDRREAPQYYPDVKGGRTKHVEPASGLIPAAACSGQEKQTMSNPSKSNEPARPKRDQPESAKAKQGAYAPKSAPPVTPTGRTDNTTGQSTTQPARNAGQDQDDGQSRQ